MSPGVKTVFQSCTWNYDIKLDKHTANLEEPIMSGDFLHNFLKYKFPGW